MDPKISGMPSSWQDPIPPDSGTEIEQWAIRAFSHNLNIFFSWDVKKFVWYFFIVQLLDIKPFLGGFVLKRAIGKSKIIRIYNNITHLGYSVH